MELWQKIASNVSIPYLVIRTIWKVSISYPLWYDIQARMHRTDRFSISIFIHATVNSKKKINISKWSIHGSQQPIYIRCVHVTSIWGSCENKMHDKDNTYIHGGSEPQFETSDWYNNICNEYNKPGIVNQVQGKRGVHRVYSGSFWENHERHKWQQMV